MSNLIQIIMQDIDIAYEYIVNFIQWLGIVVGFFGSIATGFNLFPIIEVAPIIFGILGLKMVLKRGK